MCHSYHVNLNVYPLFECKICAIVFFPIAFSASSRRLSSQTDSLVWSAAKCADLPRIPIRQFIPDIVGASTGPQEGLCDILLGNGGSPSGPGNTQAEFPLCPKHWCNALRIEL